MKTIKVLVDTNVSPSDENLKNSLSPLASLVAKAQGKVIELSAESLTNDLTEIYSTLVESVSKLDSIHEKVEIDNIQFSIGIDTSGQITLLSAISAENSYKTGITFTLRFKRG